MRRMLTIVPAAVLLVACGAPETVPVAPAARPNRDQRDITAPVLTPSVHSNTKVAISEALPAVRPRRRSMLHRRPARHRTRTLLGIGLAVAVLTGLTGLWATANAAGAANFVSPTGADTNPGTSAAAPFKTIQKALDLVAAGSTITLAPGVYRESIVTKTAGTAASPITIKGPETGKNASGRYRAVLAGKGTGGNVVSVNHSYYIFDGFTVDGQPGIDRSEYPSSLASRTGVQGLRAEPGDQHQARLRRRRRRLPRHHGHPHRQHVLERRGRRVRAVPQPRRRLAGGRLGDPVVRDARLGRRQQQVPYHNSEGVYVGTSPSRPTSPSTPTTPATASSSAARRSTPSAASAST